MIAAEGERDQKAKCGGSGGWRQERGDGEGEAKGEKSGAEREKRGRGFPRSEILVLGHRPRVLRPPDNIFTMTMILWNTDESRNVSLQIFTSTIESQ